jgi:hypothetical protein
MAKEFCVSDIARLTSELSSESSDGPAPRTSDRGTENEHLSERHFDQVVERLIHVATADNMAPSDALAALAKALGTLLAFTARREGIDKDAILRAIQTTVAGYTIAAATYMRENPDLDTAIPFTQPS